MRDHWDSCQEAQIVMDDIQADTQVIVNRFKRHFEVLGPWMIESPESLETCKREVSGNNLDMIVLAFQTWSDGALLRPLLEKLADCPLVLWCYLPWGRLPRPASQAELMRGSGPVGTFGALGILRNLGVQFLFTFGAPDDPRLITDLRVAGRAARVKRMLRSARFGLLSTQGDSQQVTYVDEGRLTEEFGPTVQVLSAEAFEKAAAPDQARVDAYLDLLHKRFRIEGVAEDTLAQAAQMSLGLFDLADENQLDVLAVNSSSADLLKSFNLRPGLYPDLLEKREKIFLPEGDLGAMAANYILYHLTDSPTMLLEVWFWDQAKNQVVGGHAGMQNPELAEAGKVWISRDVDFCRPRGSEGAQFQMIARPGRITLFQLRATPTGWQAFALSGVCLEGQPWVDSFPHAIIRLDTPIEHFLNRAAAVGVTQHWIMAYGSVLHEIEAFCQMEQIPLEALAY